MRLLILMSLGVIFCASSGFSAEYKNLIKDPDFEKSGRQEWTLEIARGTDGKGLIVDEGRSGGKCAKLEMSGYSGKSGTVKCVSGFITIPTGTSEVQVSAWIKGKDIVKGTSRSWDKLLCSIQAYDQNKKKLRRWEVFLRDGSFDWTKIERKILLPPKVSFLKLDFRLLRCTGTAWIDDVEITTVGKVAGSLAENLNNLISVKKSGSKVIPVPWREKLGVGYAVLTNPVVVNQVGSSAGRAIAEVNLLWGKRLKSGKEGGSAPAIYFQKLNDKTLAEGKLFKSDGYVLEVKNNPGRVYIKAFSPTGFFWAVQTLKQLIEKNGRIRCCVITDRPGYALRGTIIQGLERRLDPVAIKKRLDMMKSFKLNVLLSTGSLLNYKFCQKWREPFSVSEQALIKQYISACKKNFVSPLMLIAPRRFRKKNKRYGTGSKAMVFSSESDIKLFMDKVDVLYDAGARFIGIPFDDLPQFGLEDLINAQDKQKFKSVADAHVYLTNRLYQHLAKKPEPCRVVFLPAPYYNPAINSPAGEKYLKSVRKLDDSIELIICATTRSNILKVKNLTGHSNIIIWSNWLAGWGKRKPMPPILPAYPGKNFTDIIDGYICLSAYPKEASENSDYTSCDYMWNPATYNPERSQIAGLMRIFPEKSLKLLLDFEAFSENIQKNNFPGRNSSEKVETINGYIKKLNAYKGLLKKNLTGEMLKHYQKAIDGYLKKCRQMQQLFKSKAWPVPVSKSSAGVKLDGKLDDAAWQSAESWTGFIKAKTFDKAKLQTSFKLLYDKKNLYIAITCLENPGYKLKSTIKKHDAKVYLDDCVDIFIRPKAGDVYFHIIANSAGVIGDATVNLKDGWVSDKKWSSKAKVFINKSQDAWTVEMAIPFSALGTNPSIGTKWGFNIGREKPGKKKEFSSFAGVFHIPTRFWEIVFK
ncbi:MAG: beta-N-acetylglucosaminidase domain-containing protein [Victivallaceae bacterium]|nr:beta-N-acetylglucosaminidase domain-containing protein [Victivallaceae bacterium]